MKKLVLSFLLAVASCAVPALAYNQPQTATSPIVLSTSNVISCPTCNTSSANVISVSNSDGTITFSPTIGAVVGSINLAHANTWSGTQTFGAIAVTSTVSGTGFTNYLASPPAIGGTAANTGNFTALTATSETLNGNLTLSTHNIVTDATTGTDFGTATTQKIGFYGVTPIVQPTGNLVTALSNLGLVGSGTFPTASLTGQVAIANGGTAGTTAATAFSNILGNPASGTYSISCSSGSSCTTGVAAANLIVGTTTISSGTSGYIEYNNAGTLGELATTGTGSVVKGTSPTINGNSVSAPLIDKINVQKFSSSGTYTPSTGLVYAVIECWGGGGGGGGTVAGVGTSDSGGGGGAGGYSKKTATAAAIGSSQTVTIGAAGNGGAAGLNNGTAGGTTSVGSLCIANGGQGGFAGQTFGGGGGAGGAIGTGDIAASGAAGGAGICATTVAIAAAGGFGGSSLAGGGAPGPLVVNGFVAGNTASGSGAGGSGGVSNNSATGAAGGAGAAGLVVITEYVSS